MTILALMPQIRFWLARGSQWKGAYTILQPDELAYSAYINALIDGRPRRNDPSTGQDNNPEARLPESLFSIQFIPPFIIAWIAKACGASASTAFIVLAGAAGLFASCSIFWLLICLMGDYKFAAIGVLVVLCFGTLAGGQGLLGLLLKPDVKFLGLPFLRRYEPSAAFPLFFVFSALVWQSLTTESVRASVLKALLASITLALLVFSYFYLWTAAIAWLVCVGSLWWLMRRADRRRTISMLIIITAPLMLALPFYAYLVSHLPPALDKAQVLTLTHGPDLLRIPEIIGTLILTALIVAGGKKRISFSEPQAIFAASFALLPFLVFNQQIITGRSLQPFHYEVFIANYVVLLGLVMTVRLLQHEIPRRTVVLIVSSCLFFALLEVNVAFQLGYSLNVRDDELVPVLLRLKEEAKHDGTWEGLREHGRAPALVFSPLYRISELLPTWAPQGSLLATSAASFQTLSGAERKEWLYTNFYYCTMDMEYLRELLNDRTDDPFLAWRAKSTIFGPERVSLVLGGEFQPIRQEEIEREARTYKAFADSFSHEEATKRPLTYAITPADAAFDFSHLDLWYERDGGERIGAYVLYKLKLRQ
jgi:hypothetical protein